MNRNPVFPFILILLLGVGLIFFMSAHGANKDEEKEGKGGGEKTEKFDAATFAKHNCTSCHGQNLEGGMGPKLAGSSKDAGEMKKIIRDGKGSMPAHDEATISDKDLDTLVKYLKEDAK